MIPCKFVICYKHQINSLHCSKEFCTTHAHLMCWLCTGINNLQNTNLENLYLHIQGKLTHIYSTGTACPEDKNCSGKPAQHKCHHPKIKMQVSIKHCESLRNLTYHLHIHDWFTWLVQIRGHSNQPNTVVVNLQGWNVILENK